MPDTPPLSAAELATCPFCGKPASILNDRNLKFYATCTCGATVGPERCHADAISAWNRRSAPPAEVREVVEKLRAMNTPVTCAPHTLHAVQDAIALLESLSAQEARNAALEEAAKVCDEAAERCRNNESEQYGRGNGTGADIWAIRAVQNTQRATAIRALKGDHTITKGAENAEG